MMNAVCTLVDVFVSWNWAISPSIRSSYCHYLSAIISQIIMWLRHKTKSRATRAGYLPCSRNSTLIIKELYFYFLTFWMKSEVDSNPADHWYVSLKNVNWGWVRTWQQQKWFVCSWKTELKPKRLNCALQESGRQNYPDLYFYLPVFSRGFNF